ncbi:MAG: hypothetical protein JNK16_09405 [Phycisphaerales bacterium]|nr:hypothetical protein [Phycisphaerales bacterium]
MPRTDFRPGSMQRDSFRYHAPASNHEVNISTQYDLMLCADPLMPDACSADFNQDGQVDDADFGIFIPAYGAMVM